MTRSERLALLRERYFLFAGPLVLLLALGLTAEPVLAWTAGILLALLTVNKILGMAGLTGKAGGNGPG